MEEVYALSLLQHDIFFKQVRDKYGRLFGGTINDIFFDYAMIKDIFLKYSKCNDDFHKKIYREAIQVLKKPNTYKSKAEAFNNEYYHQGFYKEVILLIFKLDGARNSKINLLNCLLPRLKPIEYVQ